MIHLITVKQHEYDGKTYKVGDRYSLDAYYARQLIHLGCCEEAEENRIQPEPAEDVEFVEEVHKAKRKYQRRDMVPVK